ncbi:ROK family transcriptional regulator [Alicyclobacillaceae bacterium I2511]|nr:ROK family transcriptional regulator [Alicyclobacillaceae bacterium I2511]
MASSIDAPAMRRMNRATVFRTIYDNEPISRVQIARRLDMNKATVSYLVDELLQEKFVVEIGYGQSLGGRKPMMLRANAHAGFSIGVDVQITHVTTAVFDLKNEVVWLQRQPLYKQGEQPTPQNLTDRLEQEIRTAMQNVPDSPHGVLGVGVALPGMVNARTGYVYYLPNLEIQEWPIQSDLAKRIQFPIFIDNDANCGALAEHHRLVIDNLVFINAGIGVGGGIITDGHLYRGAGGIAGEFGHTTISAMGLRCTCGSYGCWEEYSSERALLRFLQDKEEGFTLAIPHPDFVATCVDRAQAGHPVYRQAFRELGRYLGIGMSNIVNAVNPQQIVLGGSISQAFVFIREEMQDMLANRPVANNKHTPVTLAPPESVVRGAASMVTAELLFGEGGPALEV